jgi:hypothetical protein
LFVTAASPGLAPETTQALSLSGLDERLFDVRCPVALYEYVVTDPGGAVGVSV